MQGKIYPDIYIVGTAKAGTTSMWCYLKSHPSLVSSNSVKLKELGFFSNLYGLNDQELYLSHFKREPSELGFEVCHSYITSPESAFLIHEANPKAKIVIILRNPIDRAYSLYNWMVSNGFEFANSFERALLLEDQRISSHEFRRNNSNYFYNYLYCNSGLYSTQIKRYLDIFGSEQVRVLLYDDFKNQPQKVLGELCDFFNIDDFNFDIRTLHNVSHSVKNPLFQYILRCYIARVFKFLKMGGIDNNALLSTLSRLNKKDHIRPLERKTKSSLSEFFYPDVVRTGKLIGRDLISLWKIRD